MYGFDFVYLFKCLFVSASPDPGFNQPRLIDDDVSDVIDWDRLSYLADDAASDYGLPNCPFIDWEAEEDFLDQVPEPRLKKKRNCLSSDSCDSCE